MNIFVVNAGSSSLKYQLIDMDEQNRIGKRVLRKNRNRRQVLHAAHLTAENLQVS